MSEGKSLDFISCQRDYWDTSPWHSRHHLMWHLSDTNRVLFLSPPFYIVDLLRGTTSQKTKMRGFTTVKRNLYNYVPPRYLPYNYRYPRIDKMVRHIRLSKIREKLHKLTFDRPILYIWHPNYVDLIGEFGECLVIFHKYDNYAGYYGGSGKPDPKEKELFEKADLVFVVTKGLYDLHKADCKEIHHIPHGVDYGFFSNSLIAETQQPPDMKSIPRPRIGYVGLINEKVDFELLTFLAKSHPAWSIVLIGPENVRLPNFRISLEELKEQKNCYFLGQKSFWEVPAYISGLDVCMMSYLINDWTYYGHPLKMMEYLACGKPVVSSDLPAVREYTNILRIATSNDEWVSAIEALLCETEEPHVSKRLDVARQNSWKARANTISSIITDKLNL